ncbi:hypothetical protein ACLD72_002195 [Paenibacillus sp. TH7-28]
MFSIVWGASFGAWNVRRGEPLFAGDSGNLWRYFCNFAPRSQNSGTFWSYFHVRLGMDLFFLLYDEDSGKKFLYFGLTPSLPRIAPFFTVIFASPRKRKKREANTLLPQNLTIL